MKNQIAENRPFKIRPALIAFLLLLMIFTTGCARKRSGGDLSKTSGEVAEQVNDIAVLWLEAPAFADLSMNDRIAAYHLSKAVLAGRDIPYDQIHRKHLEVLRFCEEIGLNISYGAPERSVEGFWLFLKSLWIHNGFYDLSTGRKLQFPIDARDLNRLTLVALSNSGGRLGTLIEINTKQIWITDSLFNPTIEPAVQIGKTAPPGSVLPNFYENVTLQKAKEFTGKYPQNSKLAKRRGKLVELVYRAGDENFAPGPYADHLENVIENLEKARPYLVKERIAVVDHLISHFYTGEPAHFDSAAQLRRSSEATVDFILGFNDCRFDPLGRKGLWTGILFIADEEAQLRLVKFAEIGEKLLKSFPGYRSNLFTHHKSNVKAMQLLCATGIISPLCPDTYSDPPADRRDNNGQVLVFTNVIRARAIARARQLEAAFCDTEVEQELGLKYAGDLAFWEATLPIITGLSEGNQQADLRASEDEEDVNRIILRRALSELTGLWLMTDPRMVASGCLPDERASKEVFRRFIRECAISLDGRFSEFDLTRGKALRIIGNYLANAGGAFGIEEREGRITCRLTDQELMREQIGELGDHIAELLVKGTPSELHYFIEKYGEIKNVSSSQSDGRRDGNRASVFNREAFILPLLRADLNPMGGITDVHLMQPESFVEEMYEFGGWKHSDDDKRKQ